MFKVLKTTKILPSQDFLKENTVKYILDCLKNNTLDKLPTTPIVRKIGEDYVALDGHNLIAVMDYLGREVEVYVAATNKATLIGSSQAVAARNKEIKDKFDHLPFALNITQEKGIFEFKDLVNKYAKLFNFDIDSI